ncbi:MAG: hypothetical protein WBM24_03215 [Candidatus Sulfotelmatobacter sp.]
MSKRARKMAEAAADRAMAAMPVVYKSAAYRQGLVESVLPMAEISVKADKACKRAKLQQELAGKLLARGDLTLERERVFLESVEKHYADTSGQHPMVMMHYPAPSSNGHH